MLNNFKAKFYKFMQGRYGVDMLGRRIQTYILVFLSLYILFSITKNEIRTLFSFLTLVLVIISYYRIFNRNFTKMRKQQAAYFAFENKITRPFKKLVRKLFGDKSYAYFDCPNCKEELRVPKNKGKVKIKCPKCKHEFIKRT